ncbi:MAG TPA: hypothetical protein VF503_16785 [Sphingobium sp.]|uniref:hypothetical protein n=1 Tax=Sphingobium sp. TaxID=1912891 RepID=UPI002ECFE425
MAESQYSADSTRDPDLFPHPLMPDASRPVILAPVADNGDPGAWHPPASLGIDEPTVASPTSITLYN